MWRQVVFQVSCFLLCMGMPMLDDQPFSALTGVNCIEYHEKFYTNMNEGWRVRIPARKIVKRSLTDAPTSVVSTPQAISKFTKSMSFFNNLIPRDDYLVKEHAKLVHDINSLRQVVFIRPSADENKDYDDSIFHDIIETATTSPVQPLFSNTFASATTPFSTSAKRSSIPIILLGGASQRQVVQSQPINFAKPTISLVGTTISPMVKHPYPLVTYRKPVKICINSFPTKPTRRPPRKTFWDRLVDYFNPQRNFGR